MRGRFGFLRAGAGALLCAVLAACGAAGQDTPAAMAGDWAQETGTAADSAPSAAPAAATAKSFADLSVEAINAARAVARRCGTTDFPAADPVRWHGQAEQAALTQVRYLQQYNAFSHTGEQGSSVGDRLSATGYVWSTVGENLAAGFPDLSSVVRGWLDSPSHCAVLMSPSFVHVGVVVTPGTSANTYRNYWGMVLARPRG